MSQVPHPDPRELRLAPTPDAPRLARRAVRQGLPGVAVETLETVALLVSELVTNSIRHGSPDAGESVVLRISHRPGLIRIEVADAGGGFRYEPRARPLDHAGGWGLYLVDRISHRWGIEEGSATVVWFEFDQSAGNGSEQGAI